ncbi:hypothetical protein [Pasteuria penetrans]|uniref:hypothetical protein n=1 Tax=Pasteuria penetrans TaxID=86005 RepID=UPI000F93EF73|nr:hypothetical protein [Pasteuria penetrans]
MLKSTKRTVVAGLMSCAALAAFGNGMANASCIGSWGNLNAWDGPSTLVSYSGSMMGSGGIGYSGGMGYYGGIGYSGGMIGSSYGMDGLNRYGLRPHHIRHVFNNFYPGYLYSNPYGGGFYGYSGAGIMSGIGMGGIGCY